MSLIESMPNGNVQTHLTQSKNVFAHFCGEGTLSYSFGMELKDRLQRLLDESGTNATKLAEATKLNQPTIHRILTGESKDPRHSTLEPIAKFFGISVAELRGDTPTGYYESQPITRGDRGDIRIAVGEGAAVHYTNREVLFKDLIRQLDHNEVTQLIHMLVDSLNKKSG
ncbi:helix-turn-helix domain-containing protein [Chromobacterium haemolyticum]|uniref:helix-turn-helix domain-containing protein n=1 Tax=Chromobacterium haemolyticum TaxID=394935 RepID=UPI0009D93F23|nr:XRE family transcriptional regulator [Chromobacterium haemolyticum]